MNHLKRCVPMDVALSHSNMQMVVPLPDITSLTTFIFPPPLQRVHPPSFLGIYTLQDSSIYIHILSPICDVIVWSRCSTEVTGNLAENERALDGIMGLGPRETSVISQLSSKGLVPKTFSHCLRGDEQGGGKLVLGEILDPNILYTPLLPDMYVYYLPQQPDIIYISVI